MTLTVQLSFPSLTIVGKYFYGRVPMVDVYVLCACAAEASLTMIF
jgi:hypothetical protein